MALVELAETWKSALLLLAFGGLALLGAGYLVKGPRSHDLRMAGWLVFGLYWPTQAPHFFEISDPTNAWFCLLAPLGTGYIAWHERRSKVWKEDPMALRWIAGAVFVAATTYFAIYQIPWVTDKLIHFTTWQSAIMAQWVFGLDASIGKDVTGNWNIYLNGEEYAVTVILACTAIQSMMIFVGAIACIKAPARAKWKALAASVVPIYFLNLFRNASIVWGYKVLEWNPFGWGPHDSGHIFWQYFPTTSEGSFVFIHSYVAKTGALAALVIIALMVFTLLPELHGAILDLFDLRKRTKPGFFDPPGKGGADAPVANAPTPAAAKQREPAGAK